jgi:hypothetical protein
MRATCPAHTVKNVSCYESFAQKSSDLDWCLKTYTMTENRR